MSDKQNKQENNEPEIFTPQVRKSPVVPEQLSLKSRLKFECHKGVKCFTKCCGDIDIMLTPYDVVRMKKRLGVSADDFLEKYTRSKIDEKTGWPLLYILMKEENDRPCPFVTPEGCTIYEDRPSMCRYYPVGQGIHRKEVDGELVNDEFYMLIKEDHCLGFEEDKEWTIAEWRENQGADHYDEMNREWRDIFISKVSREEEREGKKQTMFFLASYNLDQFKRFVFESRLLDMLEIDRDTVEKIRSDELELMKFSFRYLKFFFGLEERLKVKEELVEEHRKKQEEPGVEEG